MANQRNNYNRPRKRDVPAVNHEQAVVEAIFRGIWHLFGLLFKRGGSKKSGNAEYLRRVKEIQQHWQDVEMHLVQPATRAIAVSEADKLLDAGLQAKGIAGTTMGERLKAAESYFSADLYQALWQAHKLRNTLAHEIGATASAEQAGQAVTSFRNALYHLRILE